jgi:hypothetical protein
MAVERPRRTATYTQVIHIAEGLTQNSFVPFAIRLRSAHSAEHYVQVADHGENQSVVKPHAVGNCALYHWQDCAAHDGHIDSKNDPFRHLSLIN